MPFSSSLSQALSPKIIQQTGTAIKAPTPVLPTPPLFAVALAVAAWVPLAALVEPLVPVLVTIALLLDAGDLIALPDEIAVLDAVVGVPLDVGGVLIAEGGELVALPEVTEAAVVESLAEETLATVFLDSITN